LGVSEAELLASTCDGEKVVRLQGPWTDLIKQIETLGYVMALTRNEWAVHETKGLYTNVKFHDHAGVSVKDNVDLRIFQRHWEFGFAAPVENARGTLYSLQFFEAGGEAIHKVYLMKEDESMDAYKQLIQDFRHPDQSTPLTVVDNKVEYAVEKDKVDADALLDSWDDLDHTHSFFPMIREHKAARLHAIQLAEGKFTRKVSNGSVNNILNLAVENKVPIMVFVGSRGVVQIYSGEVKNIMQRGDWLNVMDPEFNLHLREDAISESWIVQKPTDDGIITSLEVFDKDENLIVNFFGQRSFGNPELESWREILNQLS